MSQKTTWGNATKDFLNLKPELILDAIETTDRRCTGRLLALNSMENRVYDAEIVVPLAEDEAWGPHDYRRFVIAKFYRPGRWSREQIAEEHRFLLQLAQEELPVVAPIEFGGKTLFYDKPTNLWFALFPKVGGRHPDELTREQWQQVGRLFARMHSVGSREVAHHRLPLTPEVYGTNNLADLKDLKTIPPHLEGPYFKAADALIAKMSPWFDATDFQRLHGDAHIGNVLWGPAGPFFFDFDDMVMGPAIQDLWLLAPDPQDFHELLRGYEQMKDFDDSSLRLVEPLRALRLIHMATWLAKRWHDPAFPRAFPNFGSENYWRQQTQYLEEQLRRLP